LSKKTGLKVRVRPHQVRANKQSTRIVKTPGSRAQAVRWGKIE
jgi:hypothetical protein